MIVVNVNDKISPSNFGLSGRFAIRAPKEAALAKLQKFAGAVRGTPLRAKSWGLGR